jgi:23S rRNA (cytidine1920-2'-O)/16S rRNA (cytidine1409-2'-O)-methyltransferase
VTARDRLDALLVARGLAPDVTRARALIMAGRVHGPDRRYDKPGLRLDTDVDLAVKAHREYVSRGGHKLAAALDAWPIPTVDRVVLDVGASTGGFSDCLLQRGAVHVHALDVGYGQLADELRGDPRVHALERTDARDLQTIELTPPPELATVDLAFVSLTAVLPSVASALPSGADVVALVKPQFEAPRDAVEADGVVRSPIVRARAVADVIASTRSEGWRVGGVLRSPLLGPKGNAEFLIWLRTPLLVPHAVGLSTAPPARESAQDGQDSAEAKSPNA